MKNEKSNSLYYVKFDWYDKYEDEENTTCAFVIAKDMASAVKKICCDFNYIENLYIEDICNNDVRAVYVPNDANIINAIKNENAY